MDEGEDPAEAALREFMEEIGRRATSFAREILQRGGKRVHAYPVEGDIDVGTIASNTFEIEWPPKSGRAGVFRPFRKSIVWDGSIGWPRVRKLSRASDCFSIGSWIVEKTCDHTVLYELSALSPEAVNALVGRDVIFKVGERAIRFTTERIPDVILAAELLFPCNHGLRHLIFPRKNRQG
jgi:8-oxo-dGTP pyrophosphatase MutT (NUDIX family)